MSPEQVIRLYDEHAPRLYALALRILGGDEKSAASVLEEVFVSEPVPEDFTGLVRAVRDRAVGRQIRTGVRSVVSDGGVPSPRQLVEEAFYNGRSVPDLAKTFSIDEKAVRGMLIEGMAELRRQVAARDTQ